MTTVRRRVRRQPPLLLAALLWLGAGCGGGSGGNPDGSGVEVDASSADADGGMGVPDAAADARADAAHRCEGMAETPPAVPSGAGSLSWSVSLRGPSDYETLADVTVDDEGNVYVVGDYAETATLGDHSLPEATTFENGLVASYSPSGERRWYRVLEGEEGVIPDRVALGSAGQVYVTGAAKGGLDAGGEALTVSGAEDLFIAAYAADDGSHLWSRTLGGPTEEYATSLVVDGSGRLVVGGWVDARSASSIDLGGGSRDVSADDRYGFVAGYEADGAHRFDHVFQAYIARANVIGETIYVSGRFDGRLTIGPHELTASDRRDHVWDGFVFETTLNGTVGRARSYGSSVSVLHFDRVIELPGDDIGLAAWLVDGSDLGTGSVDACGRAMTLFTIGTDLDPRGLTVYGDKLDPAIRQDFALRFVVREGELIGYGYYGPDEVRFVDDYRAPAGGRDAFVAGLTRPAGLSWLRRWAGLLRSIAAPSTSRIVVTTTVLDDARLTSLSL